MANLVYIDFLLERLKKLKTWIVNKLSTKIDKISLNGSNYTTTNGSVDLGTIYGDEKVWEGDSSNSTSSGWKGWSRLFRFRIKRGRGGTSYPSGSFATIGNIFAPNTTEVGQLLLSVGGNDKDAAYSPWYNNGTQLFTAKLLSNSDGCITADDIVIAVDATNSTMTQGSNIDGIINCELWVRNPNTKESATYYFSNASVMGYTVTTVTRDSPVEITAGTTGYDYITVKKFTNNSSTIIYSSLVGSYGNNRKGLNYIDVPTNSGASYSQSIGDLSSYALWAWNSGSTPTTQISGIPQIVCCNWGSGSEAITIDKLPNYAKVTTDASGNTASTWVSHTPSRTAPYFGHGVFNDIDYYLIHCNQTFD